MEPGTDTISGKKGAVESYEEDVQEKANASDTRDQVYRLLLSYQEHNAGRLVLDPKAAPAELGEEVARHLKLSSDGSKILWPQPTDEPEDPQNWTNRRKSLQLVIVTLAAITPDFNASIGIASAFAMAKQFNTTANRINQVGSSWAIFLIGWGGVFSVMLIRRYGRLPTLFWSQVLSVLTMVGCTLAPNLATSAAMRCLNGFFATCGQVSGLYIVTDMYPLHLQARKLNVWTMGFVLSPVLAPFFLGFLVARANWRWSYGIGTIFNFIVVVLMAFFMEETMYDRHLTNSAERQGPKQRTLRYRLETLIGITGVRMARYRSSWAQISLAFLRVCWRPHLVAALLFEAMLFGFGIGFHVTNNVILALPPPHGYGYGQIQIAATYASSIIAVIIGELCARYLIDWLLEVAVRRNKGVFEAECRLWACYVAVAFYVAGFVLQGAAFQMHFHIAVLVVGWILAEVAVMLNTSAICVATRSKEAGT
ncbi:MFS general substrate transporter [Lentinus brumalis]|uniref:MFS general substrate transporter n=1 Tax=Lentinus brumalis TaxID=2498619 RepID=A0A371CKI5_9APHY|nr:MFS general substrate transporter [Polyporus brumalis]